MTTLTKEQLVEHIKKHGITLVRTTKEYREVPSGTKVWIGLDGDEDLYSGDTITNYKNYKFDYGFDYQWWWSEYTGLFELIEEFEAIKVGDVVVDKNDYERVVIDVLPNSFLTSKINNKNVAECWFSKREAEANGWKIKGQEQTEVRELSMDEVAKLAGLPVDKIRIKKE